MDPKVAYLMLHGYSFSLNKWGSHRIYSPHNKRVLYIGSSESAPWSILPESTMHIFGEFKEKIDILPKELLDKLSWELIESFVSNQ